MFILVENALVMWKALYPLRCTGPYHNRLLLNDL